MITRDASAFLAFAQGCAPDFGAATAKAFGWDSPGRGSGIAAGFETGGYVATCAEISNLAPCP